MRATLLSLALLSVPLTVSAQVGKDSSLWRWTSTDDHHNAIVEVTYGGGTGTGIIVHVDRDKPAGSGYQGYCVTADHVVAGDKGKRKIRIKYRNGRTSERCKVLRSDKKNDIAVLWVWVPPDVKPARIAANDVTAGDDLEYAGLGGGSKLRCCLRHFSATASLPTNTNKIFADVPLLPGDSGGPVFNSKKELVGVISGGWFWWDGGVKLSSGRTIKATWPARSCNTGALQDVLKVIPASKRTHARLAKKE